MEAKQSQKYLATVFHLQDKKLEFQICSSIGAAKKWFALEIATDEWVDEVNKECNGPFDIVIEDVYHVQLAAIDKSHCD